MATRQDNTCQLVKDNREITITSFEKKNVLIVHWKNG